MSFKKGQLRGAFFAQMRSDFVRARFRGAEKGSPAFERERIGALQREVGPGQMHARQRFPDLAAMANVRPPNP